MAEELHFGRAAERLAVSRARVSQMIHTVERRIGAPLFERTSRRMSLTPLGIQLRDTLAPHHHGILAALARAADSAGAAEVLRAGFTHPLGSEMQMSAATTFRAERPACTVELREVQLSDRFGQLRRRELDLVFLEYHFPTHTPAGRPIHRSMTMPYWQEVMVQMAAGNGIALAAARAGHFYPRPRPGLPPLRRPPTHRIRPGLARLRFVPGRHRLRPHDHRDRASRSCARTSIGCDRWPGPAMTHRSGDPVRLSTGPRAGDDR
ncbi:LysR family transcriptional regulator [Nocardia ignorata]|uniref:LysR family transcriptional regulator n=1 Tax=Nocardia ignorata TaxID=145285 RepID=UPI0036368D4A